MMTLGTFVAPTLVAVVVAVCVQLGYLAFFGGSGKVESTITDSLSILEDRLKQIENVTISINGAKGIEGTLQELERKVKVVQLALEAVQTGKQGHEDDIKKDANVDRHAYHSARDSVVYLILAMLSALQIGLVTSIFILFRKLKRTLGQHEEASNIDGGDELNDSNMKLKVNASSDDKSTLKK